MSRRVPTVTQVAQTECGLCACVAVLRFHGRAEELSAAREAMDAGRDGLSTKQLSAYLVGHGMQVKAYRARSVDALVALPKPLILFWEDYHFLVLERFDGGTATVMDPAVGRRRLSREELAAGFSNVALSAVPGPDFETRRAPVLSEWRSVPLLADGSRRRMAAVALLSLASYGAILGIPLLTQWAIDRTHRAGGALDVLTLCLFVVAAAAGYLAVHLVRTAVMSTLVALLGDHLMTATFARLLRLPYQFFTTRQPGELLFRLNSVNAVRDMLSTRVAQGALDLGTLGCVSVYLFATEWHLGLLAAGFLLLNGLHLWATRTRVLEIVDQEISQLSLSQSTQLDAIVSIPTIKMGGYADEFLAQWRETYLESLSATKRRTRLQEGQIAGVALITQMFGPVLLLLVSLYLVSRQEISLGAAVAVQSISATYFSLSASVFSTYTEFNEASRYLARLSDISRAEPESDGGALTAVASASIELDRVGFRYTDHSPNVLQAVSLSIDAGARVAIVGPSGAGKSTLARVLCGLYAPTEGTVRFGGIDSAAYDTASLRRAIGYIPQEVHLHNRTVLENLTLGQHVSEDDVREYCANVGILDFVEELPMGLKTLVSEMGTNFSGGQRQRLALVRTLLQKPQILILDEATASLDTVNERRVTEMIEDLGTTQVIIAHRLSTIRSADVIFVMRDGQIVEHGSHTDLLAAGGEYAALYEADETQMPARPEPVL